MESERLGQVVAAPADSPAVAAIAQATRAIEQARTPEDVPFALVIQAMHVVGASAGAVLGAGGDVMASVPFGSAAHLPLSGAEAAGARTGSVLAVPATGNRLLLALAIDFAPEEGWTLVLAHQQAPGPDPERIACLPPLGAYAATRFRYLAASREADMLRMQAKQAHEQQMEMALRLYDLYDEAQNQAITDGLTGLATHTFFKQRLSQEITESLRHGFPLSLMIVDLDHFKAINDTHGHQAGDVVLKGVAAMLKGQVRGSDLVARYGGEEFVIVLPHADEEEAFTLAERLRTTLERMDLAILDERALRVTASIGLATHAGSSETYKDLIKRADQALYRAKDTGRNRTITAEAVVAEAMSVIGAPRKGSQEMFLALARALSAATEVRTPLLQGHSDAVGDLALKMAKALGLGPDKQEALMIAGMLHDVGMLAVPEAIILKPGPLSDAEWQQVRRHPAAGVAILNRFSTFAGLTEAVASHHERWDGKGYPQGLAGDDIPVAGRILAICDAYDAMTRGDYAYGMGVPHGEAIAELRRKAGTQFDPDLVATFVGVLSSAS